MSLPSTGGGVGPVVTHRYWLVAVTAYDGETGPDALQMVLLRRKRLQNAIINTERGDQYCSEDYQTLLKRHHLCGSMGAQMML